MKYLLDANTFIEPKDKYYAFDISPTYWQELTKMFRDGTVGTVKAVFEEISKGNDELAVWIVEQNRELSGVFLLDEQSDENVLDRYRQIALMVNGNSQYKYSEKARFLSGADPWLIAAAKENDMVVVTLEAMPGANTKKVKIPDICQQVQVEYIGLFDMMRRTGISL